MTSAWTLFAAVAVLLAGGVVALSRLTDDALAATGDGAAVRALSPETLLANVALTQGGVAVVLLGAVWYTGVPTEPLGLAPSAWSVSAVAVGLGAGLGLYTADEVLSRALDAYGVAYSEALREALAPASAAGWVVLLTVALPLVAASEELLFRAALVGGVAAALGVSPWLLAVLSSVLFALAHGLQGTGGVLVAGVLGLVLAAVFVLTGSFLAAAVAHYVVNAAEFVVNEGL